MPIFDERGFEGLQMERGVLSSAILGKIAVLLAEICKIEILSEFCGPRNPELMETFR